MIPTPVRMTDGNGRDVVGFEPDGYTGAYRAYVVDEETATLTVAAPPLYRHAWEQVAPSTGWEVVYSDADGTRYTEPLAGLGVNRFGDTEALAVDAEGQVTVAANLPGARIQPVGGWAEPVPTRGVAS